MASATKQDWIRLATRAVVIVLCLYLAWRLRAMLVTVMMGAVVAYLLKPGVDFFERLRLPGGWSLPRSASTLLAFILVGLCIWGLVVAASPGISQEIALLKGNLPSYQQRIPAIQAELRSLFHQLPVGWQQALEEQLTGMVREIPGRALQAGQATIRGIGFLVELFLVPVLAFYFLYDMSAIKAAVLYFLPPRYRTERFEGALSQINYIFYRYIQGQLVLCLVAGVMVGVGFWLVGLKLSLIVGIFAGLTRAIPIVGPLVGGVPIVLYSYLACPYSNHLAFAAWVTLAFSLMHLFESKWLMPRVLGWHLGIHPVLIIIALLVGYQFFGLMGMFLAAPAVAVVRLLISYSRGAAPSAKALAEAAAASSG